MSKFHSELMVKVAEMNALKRSHCGFVFFKQNV